MPTVTATCTASAQSAGDGVDWTGVGNVAASDDSRATVILLITENSEYIYGTNYPGLHAIPNGSTINSVTCNANGSTVLGSAEDYGQTVQIVTGGTTRVGNNLVASAVFAETTDADHNYTGAWGVTFTTDYIKAAGFGFAWRGTGLLADTLRIDFMAITVDYSLPAGGFRSFSRSRNYRSR